MFEITDDYINEAGFDLLSGELRQTLREQITDRVQQKVGESIAEHIGEAKANELIALMGGDRNVVNMVVGSVDDLEQNPDYQQIKQLGESNGASADDIDEQFAVLMWFKLNNIDIAATISNAMQSVMTELRDLNQKSSDAVAD